MFKAIYIEAIKMSCDKWMDGQTDKVTTKCCPFGFTTRHPKSVADGQMTTTQF